MSGLNPDGLGVNRTYGNVDAGSLKAGRLNNTYQIGSGHEYETLSDAISALSPSASNPVRLELTEDITDPGEIRPPSYLVVDGNGYEVEFTIGSGLTDSVGLIGFSEVQDSLWKDITLNWNPSDSPGSAKGVVYTVDGTTDQCRFENVTAIGHGQDAGDQGFVIRHDTYPTLVDCVGVGGGGGDKSNGIFIGFGSHPTLHNCEGYAGNITAGINNSGILISNASTPTLNNCVGVHSPTFGNFGITVEGAAAPTLNNCTGRYPRISLFAQVDGSSSVDANSNFFTSINESPTYVGPFPEFFLESIEFKIVDSGASGSTVDIYKNDTSGSLIAAGVPTDASSQSRIQFEFNSAGFADGDSLYFDFSDESTTINPRWVIGYNKGGCGGLELDTIGDARVSGGTYLSPLNSNAKAVSVGSDSISAKNYMLSNAQCRSFRGNGAAIEGASDDATQDPIYYCGTEGPIVNLTPTN